MQVFFGDERHVGPGHPDSNYQMAADAMLSKVPLQPEQIHRIKGEYPDTAKSAAEYQELIRNQFKLHPAAFPRFDLLLLGMSNDDLTLSLFPPTNPLHEPQKLPPIN